MKKLLVVLCLIFVFIWPIWVYWEWCNVSEGEAIWKSLDNCLEGSNLVIAKGDTASVWFRDKINTWTKNIAIVFSVLAVWAIVYWSLLMVVSAWEEEKLKKAKDVIKWWLIGFLWIVSASTVVALVVNIMYSLVPAA